MVHMYVISSSDFLLISYFRWFDWRFSAGCPRYVRIFGIKARSPCTRIYIFKLQSYNCYTRIVSLHLNVSGTFSYKNIRTIKKIIVYRRKLLNNVTESLKNGNTGIDFVYRKLHNQLTRRCIKGFFMSKIFNIFRNVINKV